MSKHVPPPTGEPVDAPILPADITAQDLSEVIGQLRKTARDEINRLIDFLDVTDDYVSRELEDAVDDGPCDTDELELGEGDYEPSLGFSHAVTTGKYLGRTNWNKRSLNQTALAGPAEVSGDIDLEGDANEDDEDSGDRELDAGEEPEVENGHGDGDPDHEPMLGWTEQMNQGRGSWGSTGSSEPEQGSTPESEILKAKERHDPYRRPVRDGLHVTVEQRGHGGRTVIRNLTETQKEVLEPKIDRYGIISVE